ncbi:PAS domain-containing protein [Bradyrhizobium jicamae]|nr:PAS domain-containing protein [Bradyrhizobium jicamae]
MSGRADLAGQFNFLNGGGSVGALMRAHDWSNSPLGHPEGWPQSLRSVVGLLLNSKFPMFVAWGEQLGFLYNDAYAEILGAKHPRALGARFFDIWSEIWPDISPLIDSAMAGDATYREDLPLTMNRHGHSEDTWFTFSYSPVRDERGHVAGMFCAVAETTGQVLAARRRDALLQLDERLRNVADTADISFTASELLGKALGASRAGYGTIDHEAGTTFVERNWFAPGYDNLAGLHHFSDYGSYIDDLRQGRVVTNTDVEKDPRTVANAGAFRALGIRAHLDLPITENGRTVGQMFIHSRLPRVWSVEEITLVRDFAERTHAAIARRAAEHELRLSEGRLRQLNETLAAQVAARSAERDRLWNLSQDMLARADYAGMMSAVSPAWTQILGWSEADLLARGYSAFMHPDDRQSTLAAIAQMAKTREPSRFENRIANVQGDWKHIEWTVAPEQDGENFIAVGRDLSVTKSREAELEIAREALRQSQKMEAMGQLTGGVAHDFNNLLTPIVGALDMLQRRGLGGDREKRLIAGAAQSAERAKVLVQRLLAFARRQPLQPVAVDISKLIENMAELMSSTTGPQIKVVVDVKDDLPPAKADQNQLEMALLNLAVNARDAMPNGGTLRISASADTAQSGADRRIPPGQYVRISVADTGVGMDEATLARAIEPFFSTKGLGKGTGLGLSMVHGLASQLGGALIINSKLGLGTKIELWLPQTEALPDARSIARDAHSVRGRGTALLVDDEELVRLSTSDMLVDLGYRVIEVTSAEQALGVVRDETPIDLIVTDHLMTGMSGAELARTVSAISPDIPVLIISGYSEVEGIASDLPRLTKPFRKDELMACLSALAPLPLATLAYSASTQTSSSKNTMLDEEVDMREKKSFP